VWPRAPEPPPGEGDHAHDGHAAAAHRAPVRRIQPQPPPPPPAAAGELPDTERPLGTRRVRRPAAPRAVVTPPADVPRGPAARRRVRQKLLVGISFLVAVAVVFLAVLLYQPFTGDGGAAVRVTIPAGASAGDVGDVLAGADVVDSGLLFEIRATLAGKRSELRSGPHTLRKGMSYGAAIDALSARRAATAPPATLDITIPEGRSRSETAPLARKAGVSGDYLRASRRSAELRPRHYNAPRGATLEGFLFPATYELTGRATAGELVAKQLQAFKQNFASVDLRRARRKNLTRYDVLVIASMVEREAQLARERPVIAAVIYNRLSDGMPLGIDATVRFATNNWTRPLRRSELDSDSPYNTRKRAGLPPGPIGNPGLASIRAAARPANVDYLYYVVKPGTCGEHAFSSSDAEFQADVARYNSARAQRGGNSPTTC
jgi:uncharacterized YceG family protein